MPKVFTTKIDRFNGGMVGDPRDPREAVCRASSNFDLFSQPYKLKPLFASESGDSSASTSQKQNYAIALRTGTTYDLFALGVVSGTGRAEVLRKSISSTGGSNDLGDAGWVTPSNNTSSSGATAFDLFTYYQKTGLIYGARAGTHIWAFDPTGSAGFADTSHALTYTTIREGLVHSKDDILYIPYDNKIAKNDNGSWTDVALTLPTYLQVEAIAEYGDFLAIACSNKSSQSLGSIVYLWDRDSSLTTLSESYYWGDEKIVFIETIDGILVGVSIKGNIVSSLADTVVFKYLSSSGPQEFERFEMGTSTLLPAMRQKVNGRVYFQLYGDFDGTTREGLWSIARTAGGFSVAQEFTPNNTTALTSGQPKGFIIVNDFVFQSYLDNSVYTVSKTVESGTYTTGIYETTINPQMPAEHRDKKKQLLGVRVTYEKLASGDTVVLAYKVDGATSFTTIDTASTANTLYFEKISDTNSAKFTEGTEYEFQIQSTGGAVPTSLSYKYEIIDTQI